MIEIDFEHQEMNASLKDPCSFCKEVPEETRLVLKDHIDDCILELFCSEDCYRRWSRIKIHEASKVFVKTLEELI